MLAQDSSPANALVEVRQLLPKPYRRERIAELARSAKANAPQPSVDWIVTEFARAFRVVDQ